MIPDVSRGQAGLVGGSRDDVRGGRVQGRGNPNPMGRGPQVHVWVVGPHPRSDARPAV
jgi:hypothetical protein